MTQESDEIPERVNAYAGYDTMTREQKEKLTQLETFRSWCKMQGKDPNEAQNLCSKLLAYCYANMSRNGQIDKVRVGNKCGKQLFQKDRNTRVYYPNYDAVNSFMQLVQDNNFLRFYTAWQEDRRAEKDFHDALAHENKMRILAELYGDEELRSEMIPTLEEMIKLYEGVIKYSKDAQYFNNSKVAALVKEDSNPFIKFLKNLGYNMGFFHAKAQKASNRLVTDSLINEDNKKIKLKNIDSKMIDSVRFGMVYRYLKQQVCHNRWPEKPFLSSDAMAFAEALQELQTNGNLASHTGYTASNSPLENILNIYSECAKETYQTAQQKKEDKKRKATLAEDSMQQEYNRLSTETKQMIEATPTSAQNLENAMEISTQESEADAPSEERPAISETCRSLDLDGLDNYIMRRGENASTTNGYVALTILTQLNGLRNRIREVFPEVILGTTDEEIDKAIKAKEAEKTLTT